MIKKTFLLILVFNVLVFAVSAKAELVGDLKNVNNPEAMASDSESIFVLDGIKVYQYELKTMKLKNVFGKDGNGPGEFKTNFINKLRLKIIKDKIMLSNFNKIAFFTKSGKFINEIRLPFNASQITPVDDKFLITRFITGKKGINNMGVVLYDQTLKQIKILYSKPEISIDRSRRYDAPNEMIFVSYDKEIYIADQKYSKILVFNKKGDRVKEIKIDIPIVPLTEQYKTEVMQWFEGLWLSRFKEMAQSRNLTKESMKKMIYFHKVFPAFRNISLVKNDFYIETFIKKGNKSKFIILDKIENKSKLVWLTDSEPGRIKMMTKFTYTIFDGAYYYFKENFDREVWELYKETI